MSKINKTIMASILGVELFIFFNMDMFLSGFPIYVSRMGISEDRMGVLFGAFMLAGMSFRPLFARIGQRWGMKLVLAVGTAVCLTAPWLYMAADGFVGLVFVRLFHGLVPATFITASQLLLITETGEEHKAVGLGLFGLMGGISMMVMPYVGVHLLTEYGRFVWLLAASGFGLGAMAVFWFHVRPRARDVVISHEKPAPLNFRLIAIPLLCNVLMALGMGSVITYVSTYGVSVGYENPGQFFTVLAVTNIGIKVVYSFVGDRMPQRLIMIPGTAVFAGGLVLLSTPPSPVWVIISAVPIGMGFFSTTAMMMLNVTNAVQGVQRSMAAALMANSIDLGLAAASMVLGVLVTTWSYQVLYLFAFCCAVAAWIVMLWKLRERPIPRNLEEPAQETLQA